jgi:hypothetical protein
MNAEIKSPPSPYKLLPDGYPDASIAITRRRVVGSSALPTWQMPPNPFRRGLTEEQEKYWATVETNDEILEDRRRNPPRRGPAKNYGGDGVVDTRMTHTEVTLRIARHLVESPLFKGVVFACIGGAEANRHGDDVPVFPVKSHLSRWGLSRDAPWNDVKPEWVGSYTSRRSHRTLYVLFMKHDAHILAYFPTGERLLVHCTAGNIGNTRSPAEHHDLNRVVGRAICWPYGEPGDVIAVCTPRSERFRKMTIKRRDSPGVKRARLLFLHVDRGGGILGLDEETLRHTMQKSPGAA